MKLVLGLLLSLSTFAGITDGRYILDNIKCSDGTVLKLGGKFMKYNITLDVKDDRMKMGAVAKSAKWAPFKLECTQINKGKFTIIDEKTYQGYMSLDSIKCNSPAWVNIMKKHAFGVEEDEVVFNYRVKGKKLSIHNPNTKNNFKTCEKKKLTPVYHYTLQ